MLPTGASIRLAEICNFSSSSPLFNLLTILLLTVSVAAQQNYDIETKLLASEGAAFDQFGGSVAISGNTAIVGSQWDDDNGDNSGSAYIFHFDGSSSY